MSAIFARHVIITMVDNWVVNFDNGTCKNIITGVEYKVPPYSMFRCIGDEKAVYLENNSVMMLNLTDGAVKEYCTFINHPIFNKIDGKWYAIFKDKIMTFDGFVMYTNMGNIIKKFIGEYYVTLSFTDNMATICIYKIHVNTKIITYQRNPDSETDVDFIKEMKKIVENIKITGNYISIGWTEYEIVEVKGECPICHEDFNESTEITNTICNHVFHSECLTLWLNNNKTCPMCRRSFA